MILILCTVCAAISNPTIFLKPEITRYDLFHACPILIGIRLESSYGWAAIGLSGNFPARLNRGMLVGSVHLFHFFFTPPPFFLYNFRPIR